MKTKISILIFVMCVGCKEKVGHKISSRGWSMPITEISSMCDTVYLSRADTIILNSGDSIFVYDSSYRTTNYGLIKDVIVSNLKTKK